MIAAEPRLPSTPPPPSDDAAPVGRRTAARLRLAIPARFVSIYSTQPCVLLDISRSGARLALESPLAAGQAGYIELARFELFGTVVRMERGGHGGVNAVAFDVPMTQAAVLEIRRFAEDFELRERQALRDQVRRWVSGEP